MQVSMQGLHKPREKEINCLENSVPINLSEAYKYIPLVRSRRMEVRQAFVVTSIHDANGLRQGYDKVDLSPQAHNDILNHEYVSIRKS